MTTDDLTREQAIATLTLLGWEPMDTIGYAHLGPFLVRTSSSEQYAMPLVYLASGKHVIRTTTSWWALPTGHSPAYIVTDWASFADEDLAVLLREIVSMEQT
jgi:hypothetical protein